MQNYIIMHKDRKVASVRGNGSCTVYNHRFMPYNLYLDDSTDDLDTRVSNISNFTYWCATRLLTMDRKYAKEILNSIGKSQAVTDRGRAGIAIAYHALSLTDVYWVKRQYERVLFSDINLFEHSLSDAFVDVSLRGRSFTVRNAELIDPRDAAGDIATQGVAPKAWILRNGTFRLLKNGDKRDVEAELLASRILDCFCFDHVQYTPDTYEGIDVSSSEIITSLDRSIVSMEYIDIYAMNHDQDYYRMVLDRDPYAYHAMNIADYLIGNNDRHWGNWGFWVDNETNAIQKLHPLMDFNKAFLAYETIEGIRCQTTPFNISQKDAAIAAVREIGLNKISNVAREWFPNDEMWDMFSRRLAILEEVLR